MGTATRAKPYSGQLPFSPDGHELLSWTDGFYCAPPSWKQVPVKWIDNSVWSGTMTIKDYYRGRSACGLCLVSTLGVEYPMFMRDALEMLQHADIHSGRVTGRWTGVKRGSNYGVRMVFGE